jgi:positive regulator of sigma E activity
MKASARVQDVRQGRAWLACETAAGACAACAGGRGCALRWLGRAGGGTTLEVPERGLDGRHLAPGDGVVLEVSDGELLRSAALAYLPPLAGLLGGPLAAMLLDLRSEPVAVLAAALGLALGWGASRSWLRRSPPRFEIRAAEQP